MKYPKCNIVVINGLHTGILYGRCPMDSSGGGFYEYNKEDNQQRILLLEERLERIEKSLDWIKEKLKQLMN